MKYTTKYWSTKCHLYIWCGYMDIKEIYSKSNKRIRNRNILLPNYLGSQYSKKPLVTCLFVASKLY